MAEENETQPDEAAGREAPPVPATGYGFDALVGQETPVAALRRAIDAGRLPQTLAFEGPVGVGKATCAGLLAQALNCRDSGPRDACGRCGSCRKIARGLHPDVLTLVPEDGVIKIGKPQEEGTAREVIAAVAYRPHEGRRRVVIIDDAQCLTPEAQNALLKTLEEPPASSTLILVTPAPGSLLPTVRSRTQTLRFGPLPLGEVRRYLEDVLGMPEEESRLRASLAPGSLGSAIGLDLETHRERREAVADGLRRAPAGARELLGAAESFLDAGAGERKIEKAASALETARDVLRDLVVLRILDEDRLMINADRASAWRPWAESLTPDALMGALDAVQRGHERVTGRPQPNARLALEHTLVQVVDALDDGASPPADGP